MNNCSDTAAATVLLLCITPAVGCQEKHATMYGKSCLHGTAVDIYGNIYVPASLFVPVSVAVHPVLVCTTAEKLSLYAGEGRGEESTEGRQKSHTAYQSCLRP